MKKAIGYILVAVLALILCGCNASTEPGVKNEPKTTKHYDYAGFNSIEVTSAFRVDIIQDEAYSVSVTADDFSHIKVNQIGDTLQVGRQGTNLFNVSHKNPELRITLPGLDKINFSGATQGTICNFQTNGDIGLHLSESSYLNTINLTAANLAVEASGASRLHGKLKATSGADFVVSGASIVELIGEATDLNAKVSGASRCNLINFPVSDADFQVDGASSAWVNLNGSLKANVSGASNLTYLGNPAPVQIDTSGGSYLCAHHLMR